MTSVKDCERGNVLEERPTPLEDVGGRGGGKGAGWGRGEEKAERAPAPAPIAIV